MTLDCDIGKHNLYKEESRAMAKKKYHIIQGHKMITDGVKHLTP